MGNLGFSFDGKNLQAQRWAARQGAAAVTAITNETRKALRTLISRAIDTGIPPYEAARMIRPMIGLNVPQAQAALNHRAELVESGATQAVIDREMARYVKKKIAQRSVAIARTEIMSALNRGIVTSWRQARARGFVGKQATMEWIATPDDRLCDQCASMEGRTVPLGQTFDGGWMPPIHTYCRCTLALNPGSVAAGRPVAPYYPDRAVTPANYGRSVDAFTAPDGTFAPRRLVLHEDIVTRTLANLPKRRQPVLYMTGGGPASGKSTLIETGKLKFPSPTRSAHINSDTVKTMMPEYQKMVAEADKRAAGFVHDESSMIGKKTLKEAGKRNLDVVMDTTGDGTYEKLEAKIGQLKKRGYKVQATYASTSTELSQKIAYDRGVRTGRFIDPKVIRGIHENISRIVPRALENGLFDEFTLYDTNIYGQPRLVATYSNRTLRILDQTLWDDFIAKGGRKPKVFIPPSAVKLLPGGDE